ncbi:hypothetical protein, partial [Sulfitobacter sp. MOLA879]|uniref:hypothetical protein n=1 Tax=Sulfitobacter sp. MOLA879 TaxID=3368579 RepID=UPI0037457592
WKPWHRSAMIPSSACLQLRRTDQLGRRKRPASRELHHAMGHDLWKREKDALPMLEDVRAAIDALLPTLPLVKAHL